MSFEFVRSFIFLGLALTAFKAEAQITRPELETLASHFHAEYDQELKAKNQRFFMNRPPNASMPDFWWEQKHRRASYASYTDKTTGHREHYIFFFGGYAEIPGLTLDAAVLTLCHELGHGLAGPPYKDRHPGEDAVSTEAVADDYATRVCMKRMLKRIQKSLPVAPASLCDAKMKAQDLDTLEQCYRTLAAIEFDRMYFKTDPNILEDSSLSGRDTSVVSSVITEPSYYPSAQCRIDTMLAGLFGEARPSCWWPLQTVK